MINRALIRLKVIQLLYAYYQNKGKSVEAMEKELLLSLSKAYDLYNYLLMLLVEVTKYARQVIERQEDLNAITHNATSINHRFVDNQFIAQLEVNKQLLDFKSEKKLSWSDDTEYIKKLYQTIIENNDYRNYMNESSTDYSMDRELWRRLYKVIISQDENLDNLLEEKNLYWNDDKHIVDTFVLKTIKRFEASAGADQELIPEFKDEEDREFAIRLLRRSIVNEEYYRSLIAMNVKNWEVNRLALMDLLIMQMAMAEILSFPEIPVHVTINEYLEMAKYYSTPKSPKYINGVLDHICRKLHTEGKLLKQL